MKKAKGMRVHWYPTDIPEKKIKKACDLAIDGLLTDGAHHKQWYLEQIFVTISELRLKDLRVWLQEQDCDWEDGIAP
jgi:hypothetical protein